MNNTTYTDEIAHKFYRGFRGVEFGGKETVDRYSEWSEKYEHDNLNVEHGYTHPVKIAQVAAEAINDRDARILDVCAGTGLGGQALKDLGFTNIDAVDGSEGMLVQARARNIYKNVYCQIISDQKMDVVQPGEYDAVVATGAFSPGHLGPKQLRVIADVIKSNGMFVMSCRAVYLETEYLQGLVPEMERMVKEGIWEKVKHADMENYCNGSDGKIFVYRKC